MAKLDYHGGRDDAGPTARGVDRRGLLVVIAILELVGAVVAYAGGSWVVVYQLLIDVMFLVPWVLAAGGWGAAVLELGRGASGRWRTSDSDTPSPLPSPGGRGGMSLGTLTPSGGPWPYLPLPPGEGGGEGVSESGDAFERALWTVTAVALGLGVMSLATLGMGLAGWLSVGTAIALVAGGVVAGVVVVWRRWGGAMDGDVGAPVKAWLAAPAGWHWLWLFLLPLLAVAVVGAYVPPGLLWRPDEPHGYDVVEYHFQVPREWYEAGKIVPLTHNVFSYFPFGVEMHYLLAMHLAGGPWKGMYLAQLMHAAHVVLSVVAVYGLAFSLTRRRGAAVAAGLVAGAVPWLTLLAPIGFNEGGLLLYGSLAVGWVLKAIGGPDALTPARERAVANSARFSRREREDVARQLNAPGQPAPYLPLPPGEGGGEGVRGSELHRSRCDWGAFVVAGAMAGLACGVKLTAVPTLLVALPVALVLVAPRMWRGAVVYGIVGAALFAPWALRNVAWAGNPVFPEAMNVLGRGHFSDVQVERWKRAHSPREDQRSVGARIGAAWHEIVADWRFGYVPLAAGVAAIGLALRDRRAHVLGLLLVMLLVFWLGFTHLQGRFFVLAVPVAALGVALADWGRAARLVPAAAAVWAVAAWALVHGQFVERLYGTQRWAVALAAQDLNPAAMQAVPQDATVTLVGEAQAFYYQRPMKLLRYRTVFDVGPGEDVVAAWRGGGEPAPGEWLVISPAELERFSRTYWGMAKPPGEWAGRGEPIVVPPGGVGR